MSVMKPLAIPVVMDTRRSTARSSARPPLVRDCHVSKLIARTDEGMGELAEAYGTTVSMDWVEDLASRYGLEVTI